MVVLGGLMRLPGLVIIAYPQYTFVFVAGVFLIQSFLIYLFLGWRVGIFNTFHKVLIIIIYWGSLILFGGLLKLLFYWIGQG